VWGSGENKAARVPIARVPIAIVPIARVHECLS